MEIAKISLIVPIYGTEKYIKKCCETLFRQEYQNVEFIFVNDCTKDGAMSVLTSTLDHYSERRAQVKIINHKENLGLGGTRLTGLKNASGDYLWFVDSDDYIANDALTVLCPYVESGYDVIAFSYSETKEDSISACRIKEVSIPNLLTYNVSPSIWKFLIKRSLLVDNGILPVIGINYAEDLHVTMRMCVAAQKSITLSNSYLYYYNIDNASSLVHNVNERCLDNLADAGRIVFDFYRERGALRKYSSLLACMLAETIFRVNESPSLSDKCNLLLSRIKEADRLVYLILKSSLTNTTKESFVSLYRLFRYRLSRLIY